ncbi:MAG: hypothetical protein ABI806_03165 [Candidatus Solibacter sp.]
MNKRGIFQPGYLMVALASTMFLAPHLNAHIPGRVPQKFADAQPASPPYGKAYDLLGQEWWLWSLMQPPSDNPTFGAPCANGQSGDVWFLYGLFGPTSTVNCVIPRGKSLFIPIVNTECSSLEPFPFHGDTAHDREACAKAWIDHATDLSITIDGTPVRNLAPLRTRSDDFSFTVPKDNILGVPGPMWGFSSADGYYVLLSPLRAGAHTIHIKATIKDPFDPTHPVVGTINTTLNLVVAP